MSWVLEEWKEGLPTRALQKIQELEGQLDKLKKERQQRQFQLETLEAALQKQKQKVENEKTEGTNLKRENQSLMEMCENLEKTKQKISHELQAKESQVNFQEGQLNSSKKQIEQLEQELKRYKSELERSQHSATPADVSLNPGGTPQKVFPTPLTPSQHYSGSRYEDLKEKYNKEVEERKRLEAEVKTLQAKKASPAISQSTMNHREIARHQASSSVFSWQQEKTPSRCLSSSTWKTPSRRGFSASYSAGEQDVTPSRSALQVGQKDMNGSICDDSSHIHMDQLKAQNQELRSQISELEVHLQGKEKEMKIQVNKFQELQLQLETAKVELSDKEKVLNKSRDELVRTTAQYDQASTKCATLEQKLKKLTEDLSCQRQNAESARYSLEQKIKEREKEFQQELACQQRSFQTLDQECTQMKAKLTQELQQAKNTHNILQAELDKVTSGKQQLEKKMEEFNQKFCRTEQALQACVVKENELRRSSEEMKKESHLLKNQSEQRARELCHLEDELKKTKENLNQSQKFAEEMKAKNASQEIVVRDLQEKINQQDNSCTLEKLKLALADLEKQRDCSQDLLKKREHHIEQLNEKLSTADNESRALLTALELQTKECAELKEEKTLFAHWKSEREHLLNQIESEKETLQGKINHLETCLKTQQIKNHEYNERVKTMEMERENLSAEVRSLHSVVDSKSVEMEAQKLAYTELQQKAKLSEQKHEKERENLCLKTSKLTEQVEDLEHKLRLLSHELMDKEQRYQDLHAEFENFRALPRSKDPSPEINEEHRNSLSASVQQAAVNSALSKTVGEPESMPLESTRCHPQADQSSTDCAVSQNRVASLEDSLECQKQMTSDLQKQCEELVQIKGEMEENLIKAEQMHKNFVAETNKHINKLQEDTSVHQNVIAETLIALEDKEKELQLLSEKLEIQQAEYQKLKDSSGLLEDSLREQQLLSETLNSEKKEMGSLLSLSKQEIEELTQENESLKEMNAALDQERKNLLQKSEHLSKGAEERERSFSERSDQYKQEKLTLLHRCEEAESAFEGLKENYEAVQQKNSRLECLLNECTSLCETRKNELEQLKETFSREHQALAAKLAVAEEGKQSLMVELETVQHDWRSEMTDIQQNSKGVADDLRQEIMTLKENQRQMQKEIDVLLEEKESLMKLKTEPQYQNLELAPVSNAVRERQCVIDKYNAECQMELDMEGMSLDSYNAHLRELETVIRNMELKLEESEKGKACLQQELHRIRRELEAGNLKQDTQTQEISDFKDCEVDNEEKYISVLPELSASQDDSTHLPSSLQTVMTTLSELEKMCAISQVEKCDLTSDQNDSRSASLTVTSRATEAEKLVNDVKILNDENGLQRELVKPMPEGDFGEQQDEQNPLSLSPLDDSNFQEHLTLSSKEVQMHFVELQEKFSSLQSEHKILYEQHHHMSSKMSELQSYVDTLKAENSILSMNLRNLQDDMAKDVTEEGRILSLSFSGVTDNSILKSFGEFSFCKDLLEQTGEISPLKNLEDSVSAKQSDSHEIACSSLQEGTQNKEDIPSAPVTSVGDLETLCQMYLQALKKLEQEVESQGTMKNKEIQELEQLLSFERKELDCLRKQYMSESEQWERKLKSVTVEMESQLAAEKKQTAHLSLELEVARLQLQGLDLSSRSLLGTDLEDAIQGGIESGDIKEYTPKTKRIPKQDIHQICEKDVQRDLSLEPEKITETDAIRQTGELSREPSLETNCLTPVQDRTQDSSECISESSLSYSSALVPADFLENQVAIQNLQLQVKETSNENLKLLCIIDERDKKLEALLNEIKELVSQIDLQKVQITTKIEACTELEKVVEELKKEKSDLREKLEFFSCGNSELSQKVKTLEGFSSNLDMTDKVSDEIIEDNVGMVNDNWKEKFLYVENELERMKSEKASMEHHALSMESNLETLQTEKLRSEKDNENKQNAITSLEEELSVVTMERNQLRGEIDIMSRENKKLRQLSERMKEKIQDLESHNGECLHRLQVVEAEIEEKAAQLQALSSNANGLLKEKAELQVQLRTLEQDSQVLSLVKGDLENQVGLLNTERDLLVRDLESLQNKLNQSEDEKVTHSKALEAALMEKGEIAVRLNSTQEEVHQLRSGIEKLKVRIEGDEKKQLHVLEKLKESERHSDFLKDKVENLERELQMSEENHELAILDAENSKAEVETFQSKIEEMAEILKGLELDLVTIRSEKENLTKELKEKQNQVLEFEPLVSSLRSLIEEKELEKIQAKEECKISVELLQTQLKEVNMEIMALCANQETCTAQDENVDFSTKEGCQLRNSIEKLKVHLAADEKKQLHVLETLKESEHITDLLKGRVENLERELEVAGKARQRLGLDAENSKTEAETLKAEIQEMTESLKSLELDLATVRSEKENLTKELQEKQCQMSELDTFVFSLKSLLEEKEQEKVQMKEDCESALNLLQTQLKEVNTKIVALCEDQEICPAQEEGLGSPAEEICQLRSNIEKLHVCIAADEKKQLRVLETLKESERSADLLKGRVENLERELEITGRKQELAVLDAENSKAEVETLKAKIEEMTGSSKGLQLDLVTLRSEKENLTQQLQDAQSQVSELDTFVSSLKSLLEEKEQEKVQMKEESETVVEMLQTHLKELNDEVAAMCDDQGVSMVKEEGLGSPAVEICQLRSNVEKLKVCIAAEAKKQLRVLETLKESEHNADLLKRRVENFERELEITGKKQELAVLDAENSKAEVESLNIKMEELAQNLRDLEIDLVNVRSEKENLSKGLQTEQGRVSELEVLNSSLKNLLQEKEQENVQMEKESKVAVESLQTQLKELNEKVAALCIDLETCKSKEQNLSSEVDSLEHQKAQLLKGFEEAKHNYINLQSTVDGLIQEVEDGKRTLEEKHEEINILKNQIKNQEQLASKLSQMEEEQQLWQKQKTELGSRTVELEQKIHVLQSKNATLQDTLERMQNSYKDIEKELELTKMEKISFIEKVKTLTEKEVELQREMQEVVQNTAVAKAESEGEKNRLTEELNLVLEEIKNIKIQLKDLMLENSELKESLDCVHKDQVKKEEKLREEIAEYQLQLQEAEEKHRTLLLDANKQHEMETQTYREKLAAKEDCLSSQRLEMDLVKSSKEELNKSLKTANEMLEELKKTKMDNLKYINQLKKENEHAQGKMKLLIKSCKQLEGEKEVLQKELSHLEATREKQTTGAVVDANVDELMTEIKELKETLEEKTHEADEYLDKYCSLLISHENVEKAKEMLEAQVSRLSSQQSKRNLRSSPLSNSVVPEVSPAPSVNERKMSASQSKVSGKRQRSSGIRESSGGPAPSTPETVSKKSRKAASSGVQSAGDTEDTGFEPEGLPEVVKKGFADIPTGKTSPYILRRTTMTTRTSPRLAAQKSALSPLSVHQENLAETSKPTPGGSRPHKGKTAQQSPENSDAAIQEPVTKSLSSRNCSEKRLADSPREGLRAKRVQFASSSDAGPDLKNNENCRVQ
ncbi:centromere protein F [Tenrec ecaudatus]|uniref:centromere protein F n=1 Tax=Tenrec ecaudatus TaxID=94439 RepID=UPI003F5A7BFC